MTDTYLLKLTNYKSTKELLERDLSPFFIYIHESKVIVDAIRINYPSSIENTIKDADEICSHLFKILGSTKRCPGKAINWHYDFNNGYKWEQNHNYMISNDFVSCYLDKDIPADVKVPWELSRCQHFVTLGKAYWYTSDEKYAKEFADEIESWIEANPMELGVNWACTMDVAIRAVNWIWGYYFFNDSKTLTDEFRIKLLKSLFLHGRHVMNNLEFGVIRGNHYLSDIVGLVYLGIFFKDSKEGKKWLDKGISALLMEMKYQVHEDGVDFEGSISYHRLVTELFLSATVLCMKNGTIFPEWYMRRLEKMIYFVMYYTEPDGTAPQIGDNDDGRLHILADYGSWDRQDHRYLLSTGSVLFERPDFKSAAGKFHEESFWLMGLEGIIKYGSLPPTILAIASQSFESAGFYMMRSGDSYAIIDVVPVDKKAPSGHRHNSRLSFELYANGQFIVDPGTFVYTADKKMRDLFRSTAYHNTIVVDDIEQNRIDNNLFLVHPDASVKVNEWLTSETYDYFDAEHYGYKRLDDPVVHRRKIYFNKLKKFWIINDLLEGKNEHKISIHFHLSNKCSTEIVGNCIHVVNESGKISIISINRNDMNVDIQKGYVSPSYGIKTDSEVIKYSGRFNFPVEFLTLIVSGEQPSMEEIRTILKNIVKTREDVISYG